MGKLNIFLVCIIEFGIHPEIKANGKRIYCFNRN